MTETTSSAKAFRRSLKEVLVADVSISHDFVRALTKNIRGLYGKEPKHTEVMDLVASSLGWSTDALMHRLKNAELGNSKASFEAPDEVDGRTLKDWVLRREWRNTERWGLGLIKETKKEDDQGTTNETSLALLAAFVATCRLALHDPRGAEDVLRGHTDDSSWFGFIKAIIDYVNNGPSASVKGKIVESMEENAKLVSFVDLPRKVDMYAFEGALPFGNDLKWEATVGLLLRFFPEWGIIRFVRSVAVEAGLIVKASPAVPIEESVEDDHLICLFDGEKRKMLQSYIRTKFKMSADEYRCYWGLPDDYPMVAPEYEREKRLVAATQGLGGLVS